MYFAPKNCFFSLICQLQNWKWNFSATLLQLPYVVIYLVNCLKLEKSCFKIHFQFCSFQKRLKKQFFGAKYKLFCKRCSLRSQASKHQNIAFNSFQTCWDTLYKVGWWRVISMTNWRFFRVCISCILEKLGHFSTSSQKPESTTL